MRKSCIALAVFALGFALPAAADDTNVAERVPAVMERLASGDDDARSGAVKELAALGTDAIGPLLRHLPPDPDFDAWDALAEAFARMGVEDAIGEMLSHRRSWPHARRDTLAGFESVLRERLGERGTYVVRLKEAPLSRAALVPLRLRHPVLDGLPLADAVAPGQHLARVADGVLAVDTTGDGRSDLEVKPGKDAVAGVGPGKDRRSVAFFQLLGQWYAGPAATLQGSFSGAAVEILDGDLDGRFDGDADYVRIGDGAFQRHTPDRLLATKSGVMKYRFVAGGKAPVLELRAEPMPPWATREHRAALEWLNRWRGGCGLPAVLLDRRRSQACELHSAYMARHGLVHEEHSEREGYTKEGNRAGRSSSLSPDSNPAGALHTISATVLHRNTCVGRRTDGLGLGFRGGGGSVMWGGSTAAREMRRPVVVPGPGQRDVPLFCESEMPRPDVDERFYARPRGYPVSAGYVGLFGKAVQVRLEVFVEGDPEPVEGYLFTPEQPYSRARPANYGTAHFVAAEPLVRRTTYVARLSAQADGKPVEFVWSFRTR